MHMWGILRRLNAVCGADVRQDIHVHLELNADVILIYRNALDPKFQFLLAQLVLLQGLFPSGAFPSAPACLLYPFFLIFFSSFFR